LYSRLLLLFILSITVLLYGCAHPQPLRSISVSDVRVELPQNEEWKLLNVSELYAPTIPTIAFVQLDGADTTRIRSIFRVSVLALNQIEPVSTSADTCLSLLSRFTTPWGLPGINGGKPITADANSHCAITGPGNQTTSNWFEKSAGPLKAVTSKEGLHFVNGVVGQIAVSNPFGQSRRLSISGFVSMGPSEDQTSLPTAAATKQLSGLTKSIFESIKGAEAGETFVIRFPSPTPAKDASKSD
jgi:hypothetical protein